MSLTAFLVEAVTAWLQAGVCLCILVLEFYTTQQGVQEAMLAMQVGWDCLCGWLCVTACWRRGLVVSGTRGCGCEGACSRHKSESSRAVGSLTASSSPLTRQMALLALQIISTWFALATLASKLLKKNKVHPSDGKDEGDTKNGEGKKGGQVKATPEQAG